jgi:hypothetical protein
LGFPLSIERLTQGMIANRNRIAELTGGGFPKEFETRLTSLEGKFGFLRGEIDALDTGSTEADQKSIAIDSRLERCERLSEERHIATTDRLSEDAKSFRRDIAKVHTEISELEEKVRLNSLLGERVKTLEGSVGLLDSNQIGIREFINKKIQPNISRIEKELKQLAGLRKELEQLDKKQSEHKSLLDKLVERPT